MNRLQHRVPGGDLRFAGSLSEQAAVTIETAPADVTSDNRFELGVPVTSGANQVEVRATDAAGNTRTNAYEVSNSGSSKTYTFDENGNVIGDGAQTFKWDAEDNLLSTANGSQEFVYRYDGFGRRVGMQAKESGGVISDTAYVWCGESLCEERQLLGVIRQLVTSTSGFRKEWRRFF